MSTKIGLISDVHATAEPLREAFSIFRQNQVDLSLCAGDIAEFGNELDQTVDLLLENNCQAILGNHDLWFMKSPAPEESKKIQTFLSNLPESLNFTIEGKKLHMVHASPPGSNMKGIRLLDEGGSILANERERWVSHLEPFQYDVLVVGHTHQIFAERLGNTLVVNPGSTLFNHTCAILTLPELTVEILPLPEKTPVKTWNWGQIARSLRGRAGKNPFIGFR